MLMVLGVQVFSSEEVRKYVLGVVVYWYQDFIILVVVFFSIYKKFLEKFILVIEVCFGVMLWDIFKVFLGSWKRGEDYVYDIIQVVNFVDIVDIVKI